MHHQTGDELDHDAGSLLFAKPLLQEAVIDDVKGRRKVEKDGLGASARGEDVVDDGGMGVGRGVVSSARLGGMKSRPAGRLDSQQQQSLEELPKDADERGGTRIGDIEWGVRHS